MPGNIRGQAGWGSEQPALGEGVPAHCRGLDSVASKGPFQPKALYDSIF